MSQKWHELADIFGAIGDCYERMIELAEEKRQALVSVNVDVVSKIIVKEEQLVGEINAIEAERLQLVEQIASESGWTDQKIKLLDLVERAPADFSSEMHKVGQRLADIVMRIALLNGINNNLLKQAMRIIDYNINILSRAQASSTYGAGGNESQEGKSSGLSFLDHKA